MKTTVWDNKGGERKRGGDDKKLRKQIPTMKLVNEPSLTDRTHTTHSKEWRNYTQSDPAPKLKCRELKHITSKTIPR
jgi:hypothetical protein